MVSSVGNSTGQSILTALNAGGGIDTNNLATSLVNAEKLPQQNIIDSAKTKANTTISSVGKVKSALTSLQTTLTSLGDAKSFQTTAVSSDPSKVTVAFKTGVTPPTFSNSIDVQQIATETSVLLPAVTSQDGSLLGTTGVPRTFSLVSGSVQNSVVNGVAMTLPATAQTGTMTVNGVTTASFTLGTTSLSDNRKAVVAAINAISSQTGVSAVDNGDDTKGITLTAGDGRAISTSFIPAGATESANVTFKDMVAGSSLTLGGLTFTAATDMTSAQVAAAFASRSDGTVGTSLGVYTSGSVSGSFTGTLSGWSSGSVNGSNVTFKATGQGNVTDLNSVATTPAPSVSTTQGAASTVETAVVNFGSLAAGSSVTVAGLTLTATTAMTSAQVATAFASLTSGAAISANYSNGGVSGTFSVSGGTLGLTGWSSGAASGSSVTFSAATSGNVTDLAVGSNAASPSVVITNGQSATQQTSSVAFNALAAGNSITVGGLTLLANTAMSATDVAQAFASRTDGAIGSNLNPYSNNGVSATFSGTLSGWTSGAYSAGNNALTFTATTAGTVPNLSVSAASTVPMSTSTQGASTSIETTDITFNSLAAGSSVTIGGLTLTATTAMTAAQVATAFASRADGVSGTNISPYSDGTSTAVFTGSLNGWSSGTVSGSIVRFSSTASGNVTDLTYVSATGQPDVVKVEPSGSVNEVATITFKPLAAGSSVTVAGLTYTATSSMTAAQVAAVFASKTDGTVGSGQFSGTLSGWSSGTVSGSSVNFTATAAGNVTDISQSAAIVAPTTVTTTGVAGNAETNAFTFPTLAVGDSITVGGLKFTLNATNAGLSYATGAQIAAIFANKQNGFQGNGAYDDGVVSGSLTGTLSGWSTGDNLSSSSVTFTSANINNVTNLTYATETSALTLTKNPNTSAYEYSDVTFPPLISGGSVTVGGLTFTANQLLTSVQVANAFEGLVDGSQTGPATSLGAYTGTLSGWSTGSHTSSVIRFTSSTVGNVTDITTSTNQTAPTITTLQTQAGNANRPSIYQTTFPALNPGQSVNVGGLNFTATTSMTAAQVAAAFSGLTNNFGGNNVTYTNGTVSGYYNGFLEGWTSDLANGGTTVNFTGATNGNNTLTVAGIAAAPTVVTDQGYLNAVVDTVSFKALAANSTTTVGGLTLTASANLTAAQVASAFANIAANGAGTNGAGYSFSGSLSGWKSSAASSNNVVFTSVTAGNTSDVTTSTTIAAATAPVTTAGVVPTSTTSTVTFKPLESGDSVTVGGLTLTATSSMAATDVATAFANRLNGTAGSSISPYVNGAVTATFSGTLQGWSTGTASTTNVVFTASTTGPNPAVASGSTPGSLSVSTVQGPSTTNETNTLTFKGLNSGASLTIGGLRFTASSDLTAAQVASAFASIANGASGTSGLGTYTGTLSGWSSSAVTSGNKVVLTASTTGNVTDLAITTTPPTGPTAAKVDGGQPTKETSTVTFSAMVSGNSVTIGGLTFTATSTMTAAQVATAFSNLADGKTTSSYSNGGVTGQFTGTLSGWSSGASSSGNITFTATNTNNITDLSIAAAAQSPTVTTTQVVSATAENAAVTFKGLASGSSVTVAGLTLTASTDMTDVQVAAAFANRLNGASGSSIGTYTNGTVSGVFSGSLAGWASSTTNGAVVNFSAATTGNVPDLTVSTSMPSPVVNTTQGTAATNEQSRINFTALAAGSSLTVAGLTLNATVAMSASQVAAAFASIAANGSGTGLAGSYSFSGSLTGWSSGTASSNSVLFTASTTGNVADISLTNAASAPVISTNQGASGLTSQMTGVNIGQYVTSTTGNSMPGTSMAAPTITSPATSVSGILVINNTSISVTLTSDLVANRAAIVAAINAQTKTTGVTAINSGTDSGGISLTAASTQSISLSFPSIIGSSSNPTLNPLSSSTTGLREGRVNAVTKLVGGAMTAPTTSTTGTIKINGVGIALSLGTDATTNRTNIIAAINAQTGNTGVTASANAGDTGITLTAADGRAIKTDLGSTLTEAQTGLKKNVLISVDMTSTSNDTLLTLRDKINAVSGMTATIVQGGTDTNPLYYLSVKSGLGVVNNFYADVTAIGGSVPLDAVDTSNSVPATDGLLGNYYTNVTLGQDAKINVDGVSITSSTNTFDKAIPNVIITAVGATNGSPVTIKSQTNTTALTNAINSLVTGYNQVISTMAAEMSYNSTDPTKNGGLANNAIARTLISQLRAFTTQSITGYDGSSHTLADIGIKTNRDGSLTLDSAAFDSVLSTSPDLVAAVLASKQTVSDTRLALGGISPTAKTGVYTVKKQVLPPTVTNTASTSTANATASVQFYSLKSGANVTVGGLTFTATTDMTAEEVATAFSSLSSGATSGPSTAKGTYSGTLSGWNSSLLTGSSIKFTAANSGSVANLTASGTSLGWTINGEPAILTGSTLTATSTSAAAGISLFVPTDLSAAAADGFTATLNYSQGIIERFNNMINSAIGTSSSLQNLIDNQNSALSDLDKKQTTLDARMAAQLTRYQQQFTTLTALLNKAKSTQSQLTDFQTAWSNSLKGN